MPRRITIVPRQKPQEASEAGGRYSRHDAAGWPLFRWRAVALILFVAACVSKISESVQCGQESTCVLVHKPEKYSSDYKIFGIGAKKTGTTSLDAMYRQLFPKQMEFICCGKGTHSRGKATEQVTYENDTSLALELADKYKYFQDSPWCSEPQRLYRTLAVMYPKALFVLTVRDAEKWWQSVADWTSYKENTKKNHGPGELLQKYADILGAKSVSKEDMIAAYESHNSAVRRFFNDEIKQPSRLLDIDITDKKWKGGSGWATFCHFISYSGDCPGGDLPFENKTPTEGNQRKHSKAVTPLAVLPAKSHFLSKIIRSHRDMKQCDLEQNKNLYHHNDTVNLAIARAASRTVTDSLRGMGFPAHHDHDCTLLDMATRGATKVVVLLRDPVERILSGYKRRMEKHRNGDQNNKEFYNLFKDDGGLEKLASMMRDQNQELKGSKGKMSLGTLQALSKQNFLLPIVNFYFVGWLPPTAKSSVWTFKAPGGNSFAVDVEFVCTFSIVADAERAGSRFGFDWKLKTEKHRSLPSNATFTAESAILIQQLYSDDIWLVHRFCGKSAMARA